MMRPELGIKEAWSLPLPNFRNAAIFMTRFPSASIPWEPAEFVNMYAQNVALIQKLAPDLVVVDPLYMTGMTAAQQLKVNWTVLAPNTIKDFAALHQPLGAGLWKYPVVGSGLPFRIPWSQIPLNIGLTLVLVISVLRSKRQKEMTELLRHHVGDENLRLFTLAELGVVQPPPKGVRVLVGFSEDLDFPFAVMPSYITQCGPIVRYARQLTDVDAALEEWLSRGPTIYINLGTQLMMTPEQGLEFAFALREFLDAIESSSEYQVLWKLKQEGAKSKELSWEGEWKAVRDTLFSEMEADRVRITSWIEADPCSILRSGHIVCSVHHGGANSHHEAIAAGVPQVVLAGWIDCYDFASRVELNGVGLRANKTAAPRWKRAELAGALKEVLLGERAATFKENARKLAEKHPEHAGRTKAAASLLRMLEQAH
ncbi:hypothetical protein N0V93_001652 [Gnomoniopsis smithogilvyi]|uniref:Erythromycin biosynthesis protein CIII-like C-terminal domain-containing protein n=1 Tax=Gnomoniopsis smithogilvyi TaxID=1191159 RepID=A0A9W8Z5X4_9PEZI|nr:hypothetical protein N0V93_001652 [Gnomoniopsis smithogilvyi]